MTDATIWETVMVLVRVCVDVRVVVNEVVDCATASRGRRRPVAIVEMRILKDGVCNEGGRFKNDRKYR